MYEFFYIFKKKHEEEIAMLITLPEEYGFVCTQLNPNKTGLPVRLLAHMNTTKKNKFPFLLYSQAGVAPYGGNTLWPIFFHCPINRGTLRHEVYFIRKTETPNPLSENTLLQIEKFIWLNKSALLSHWKLESDSLEFLNQIKPV